MALRGDDAREDSWYKARTEEGPPGDKRIRGTTVRILFPTDGSAGAGATLDKLIDSFLGPDLLVDLLYVVDRRARSDAAIAAEGQSRAADILASERLRLEQAQIELEIEVAVRSGHPAEEIVDFATAFEVDLVILGSRSASSGRPGFSGSVASKVARYSPSSVMIARDGRPIRSVILGYDDSPDADEALTLLVGLPFRVKPHVTVLTAFEGLAPRSSDGVPTLGAQGGYSPHEELEEAKLAAEAMADEAAGRLREAGLEATAHVAHGRAGEQLAVLAGEIGADLILVGSRGLSGIERFLLGSTSGELVALAPTSLLVARS